MILVQMVAKIILPAIVAKAKFSYINCTKVEKKTFSMCCLDENQKMVTKKDQPFSTTKNDKQQLLSKITTKKWHFRNDYQPVKTNKMTTKK